MLCLGGHQERGRAGERCDDTFIPYYLMRSLYWVLVC